jgi:hypothetical protein
MTTMLRIGCTLCFLLAAASSAKAQTLDYTCNVGPLQISIHVDIDARSVTQRVYSGSTVLTAEYMNGVFGRVSERGMATLIPPMHQFVHIDQDAISYGGELDGARDAAILDRRKSILTLPNGKAGWCSMASSSQE